MTETSMQPDSVDQSNADGPAANENSTQNGRRNERRQRQLEQAGLLNDFINNPEKILDVALEIIFRFWAQVRRIAGFIMHELGGYELFDMIALWCVRNPHIAICLLVISFVLLMPFLIIFGFGIATMIMTFTGILVLEGTLLTLVSMVFFACLGCLVFVVVLFSVIAVAAYFGFVHIYDFYGGMERHRETLMKYVQLRPRTQVVGDTENFGSNHI